MNIKLKTLKVDLFGIGKFPYNFNRPPFKALIYNDL